MLTSRKIAVTVARWCWRWYSVECHHLSLFLTEHKVYCYHMFVFSVH